MANRRQFIGVLGAAAAFGGAAHPGIMAAMRSTAAPQPPTPLTALAFDAYGTLFDVFSVTSLCDQLFPGNGNTLAQLWRAKQLQYSPLRARLQEVLDVACAMADGDHGKR